MQVLILDDISKSVKQKIIYSNISMHINEGECYAIAGNDDAGKTSILDAMLGFQRYDSGNIMWFGEEMKKGKFPDDVSYLPDDLLCFSDMSGVDFLDMTMKIGKSTSTVDEAKMLIDYFEVEPMLKLEEMDEEMNKCVYIISAFLSEAKVLVLDEPFNFLGSKNRKRLMKMIKKYVDVGNTVIITCSDVEEIREICTRFSVIERGKQIRCDEEMAWYSAVKLVTVYNMRMENMSGFYNMKNVITVCCDREESKFIYTGDTVGLKRFINHLNCDDFVVEDITVQQQMFKEFDGIGE